MKSPEELGDEVVSAGEATRGQLALLEPVLAIDEIQGNILEGFNKDHQAVIPLYFAGDETTVATVRRWLANVVHEVTWLSDVLDYKRERRRRKAAEGREPDDMPAVWLNLSFSYQGLRKLTPTADDFDVIFRDGLSRGASARLGDPTTAGMPGHIDSWLIGKPGAVPDMLAIIAGDRSGEVVNAVEGFLARASLAGISSQLFDIGHDLAHYGASYKESGHEHFGFKDGISQPGVRGRINEGAEAFLTPRTGTNDPDVSVPEVGAPGQALVCAGEFLLGYPRQNASVARGAVAPAAFAPAPQSVGPSWAKDGSFLVFRRLRQDVPAFNRFLDREAARISNLPGATPMSPTRLGALLVGRWPSGAPVLRSPAEDSPCLGGSFPANNDFAFDTSATPDDGFAPVPDDPFGRICPQAAHIRKVNPRDLNTDQGALSQTLVHRILRRGIPYGPPLPFGATVDADDKDRGLLFLSYQASIVNQLEFLTARWMNDASNPSIVAPPAGSGYDMVVGQAAQVPNRSRFCLIGASSTPVSTDTTTREEWVIPTGGGYFFTPSRSAIRDVLSQAPPT